MDPITAIAIATALTKFAIEFGPAAARALQKVINTPNPTQEDWDAVWDAALTHTNKFLDRTKGLDAPQ